MDPSQILTQILAAAGVSTSNLPSQIDLSPGNILRAAAILIVVYILARVTRTLVKRFLHASKMEERVVDLVAQIAFYGVIGMGVVWVLGGFGLSVVILGIAAGFALKDLIQNFAAGLLIMGTRPLQIGDWVQVSGYEGRVAEVGWRGTFLTTFDGRRVIIPNSMIVTNVVVNNSLQSKLRSNIPFSVDLQTDFGQVEQLVLEALKPIKGIAEEPPPTLLLDAITVTGMNLVLSLWINEPVTAQQRVLSQVLRAVKDTLAANGVELRPATVVPAVPASPR